MLGKKLDQLSLLNSAASAVFTVRLFVSKKQAKESDFCFFML